MLLRTEAFEAPKVNMRQHHPEVPLLDALQYD